jgi:hypothetical protein
LSEGYAHEIGIQKITRKILHILTIFMEIIMKKEQKMLMLQCNSTLKLYNDLIILPGP